MAESSAINRMTGSEGANEEIDFALVSLGPIDADAVGSGGFGKVTPVGPSPVPLSASLPLLPAGLSTVGVLRRRKSA